MNEKSSCPVLRGRDGGNTILLLDGKTQLALEYAHRSYRSIYRAVFWVNAADKLTLQAEYDTLAHLLELPERYEDKPDQRVKAVKTWLEGHDSWLLILDNADDLQLVRTFLPVTPLDGHIVLTTRSQIVGGVARRLEIEKMEPKDGLLFLLKRAGMVQNEADIATLATDVHEMASQLVQLLDGHPLALDQAGAYVEETEVSFAGYIQLYQKARRFLLDRRGSSESEYGDHPETVAVTIELSFRKAFDRQPIAADLLYFCSFLQPDAIPEEVLQQTDGLELDRTSFGEVIKALKCYSLIKRNTQEKTFSMHRLVQAVLIDTLSPDLQTQWRARVVRALNAAFPEVDFKEWRRCRRLLPHALVCAMWTEYEVIPTLEVSELFHKAGIYLRERGQYAEAEALLLRALSIREQQLGGEHLDTARNMNNLAILYRQQGKYDLAEPLYHRALSIRKRHLGVEHPDTVKTMNNLAELYRHQGKYEQAELLCQQVLAIREQHLGAEHPLTAMSLTNLANCYWDQKKYDLAEPLYHRALSIFKQQLGAEHPDTASGMNNLAEFYWYQGKYEQAETLYEQALTIREQHLGAEHPATARSLHGFARLLHDQGTHERAAALYRRALSIQEQQLGATHPHTQETRKDYTEFLHNIGRDVETAAVESSREPDIDEEAADSSSPKTSTNTPADI